MNIPRKPPMENEQFNNEYDIRDSISGIGLRFIKELGKGSYSESVALAFDPIRRRDVAVKVVRSGREGLPLCATRELIFLKGNFSHPNIVNLFEVRTLEKPNCFCFLYEYIPHDLSGILGCPFIGNKFSPQTQRSLLQQILSAVNYIHKRNVVHLDLKPANILVSNEGRVKLADFGLATKTEGRLGHKVITLWWRPPELILGERRYTTAVDMWSVGCIFAELLMPSFPLFCGRDEEIQLLAIFQLLGTLPAEVEEQVKKNPSYDLAIAALDRVNWVGRSKKSILREYLASRNVTDENAIDLLCRMLQLDPRKRISAEDALSHPYFNNRFSTEQVPLIRPGNEFVHVLKQGLQRIKKPSMMNENSGVNLNDKLKEKLFVSQRSDIVREDFRNRVKIRSELSVKPPPPPSNNDSSQPLVKGVASNTPTPPPQGRVDTPLPPPQQQQQQLRSDNALSSDALQRIVSRLEEIEDDKMKKTIWNNNNNDDDDDDDDDDVPTKTTTTIVPPPTQFVPKELFTSRIGLKRKRTPPLDRQKMSVVIASEESSMTLKTLTEFEKPLKKRKLDWTATTPTTTTTPKKKEQFIAFGEEVEELDNWSLIEEEEEDCVDDNNNNMEGEGGIDPRHQFLRIFQK